jgi:hypothetical protein
MLANGWLEGKTSGGSPLGAGAWHTPARSASRLGRSAGEDLFGFLHVQANLVPQLLDSREAALISQPFDEPHRNPFVVDVFVEIKNVDFHGKNLIGKGRVEAQVGGTTVHLAFGQNLHGVDTVLGAGFVARLDVGGHRGRAL